MAENKVVGKRDLVNDLAAANGITKTDAGEFLDSFYDIVQGYLSAGRAVRLTNVGKLYLQKQGPRRAYNPRDRSIVIDCPARFRLKVEVAAVLQESIDALDATGDQG